MKIYKKWHGAVYMGESSSDDDSSSVMTEVTVMMVMVVLLEVMMTWKMPMQKRTKFSRII